MRNRLDKANIDSAVVSGFGYEWQRFDQRALEEGELQQIFEDYFRIFPWSVLSPKAVGADIGCGSGRWAQIAAPRVGFLHLVDASKEALSVARGSLSSFMNVDFHQKSVGSLPFADGTLDFAYSLGVLHHVPDTRAALREIARTLKADAPFLLLPLLSLENRPPWYRTMWKLSDVARRLVARLPDALRHCLSAPIALFVYWPLARSSAWLDRHGHLPSTWPLAYYRDKSFYTMRTDALDRFGTPLEQRFTKSQISRMLRDAGFNEIKFSGGPPSGAPVCRKVASE